MADIIEVGIAYDGRGLKNLNADLGRMNKNAQLGTQSAQRLERSVTRTGGAFQGMGSGVQNTAFQLQDIIVQMEMGIPLSRTLGQQLPQLLGGFGPLGAVLGVVAGGMAALVPLMFDFNEGAEDAEDAADRYKDALSAVADQLQENITLQRQLNGTFEGTLVDPFIRDLEALEAELKSLEKNYKDLARAEDALRAAGVREERIKVISEPLIEQEEKIQDKLAEIRKARNAQSAQFELENRKEIHEQILEWEEEQAEKGLKAVKDLRREREKAHEARMKELKDVDELIRKSGGSGSLVTGGPSRAAENYIAGIEYRVERTREGMDREREMEERVQKAKLDAARRSLNARLQLEKEAEQEMERVGETISASFENAFASIIQGTKDAKTAFSDMAMSIISDIARIVIQQQVSKPIGGFLSSALKGAFGGFFGGAAGTQDATVGYYAQANGGAWRNGVQMFANGGIVNGPTLFPMANGAGLMGEAGPEAIMPLKRGPDGKLGVAGGGGGQTINVNVINENGGEVETQQNGANIDVYIRKVVAQDIKGGGAAYQAISKTFNIQPGLTRRQ